jgi:hypothetical protein
VILRALLLVLLVACGNGSSGAADASPTGADAADPCAADAGLAFGAACTEGCTCVGGVCHMFGDGSRLCTQSCTADDQCPQGSQGARCNQQNVCRP